LKDYFRDRKNECWVFTDVASTHGGYAKIKHICFK
jgi:hypothetical protein